ncbi:hypothetical protein HMN09_00346000 [Mycena chlorophos]|uniref:Uncharacterized protein n=1 Tax=Mycena chlorophos TaxID=658473 RepID=A0A8H6TKJ6_MYCCL|nr:hypothetical protein HMN09_00346000 [Mycena chlorophos]
MPPTEFWPNATQRLAKSSTGSNDDVLYPRRFDIPRIIITPEGQNPRRLGPEDSSDEIVLDLPVRSVSLPPVVIPRDTLHPLTAARRYPASWNGRKIASASGPAPPTTLKDQTKEIVPAPAAAAVHVKQTQATAGKPRSENIPKKVTRAAAAGNLKKKNIFSGSPPGFEFPRRNRDTWQAPRIRNLSVPPIAHCPTASGSGSGCQSTDGRVSLTSPRAVSGSDSRAANPAPHPRGGLRPSEVCFQTMNPAQRQTLARILFGQASTVTPPTRQRQPRAQAIPVPGRRARKTKPKPKPRREGARRRPTVSVSLPVFSKAPAFFWAEEAHKD